MTDPVCAHCRAPLVVDPAGSLVPCVDHPDGGVAVSPDDGEVGVLE